MSAALLMLILVVVTALAFDYINGFHDAANAVATVVSTGVLPLRTAILLAALLNFVGALSGTAVASTIGKGLVAPGEVTQVVVLSALLGAIAWNLFTWYFGIPSSSSHALVGGLVGAGLARAGVRAIQVEGLLKIVESLIVSPLVGFALGFVLMIAILWACRRGRPSRLSPLFRRLQILSAGFMAISHGSNDAQKTMGIITMSLVAYGAIDLESGRFVVPTWVILACAAGDGPGDDGRRRPHHQDDGDEDHRPEADPRVRRRDRRRDHHPVGLAPGPAGLDDARHHRLDHGGGGQPARLRGPVGGHRPHPLGLGADHPHQRGRLVVLLRSGPPGDRPLIPGNLSAIPARPSGDPATDTGVDHRVLRAYAHGRRRPDVGRLRASR